MVKGPVGEISDIIITPLTVWVISSGRITNPGEGQVSEGRLYLPTQGSRALEDRNYHKTTSSADADNPHDAMLDTYSGQSTVWFHYIFHNYIKAFCMLSTAVRGSASDVTSPSTAVRFNSTYCRQNLIHTVCN